MLTLLEEHWGLGLQHTTDLAKNWDYESDHYVVEYKNRNNPFGTYPTLYLSLRKYNWLNASGKRGIFLATWMESEPRWIFTDLCAEFGRTMSGHARPRARMDREMMIEVPVAHMLTLEHHPALVLV